MKKRMLSVLMCLVMVIGLFPGMTTYVHADYSDGADCPDCGHYHYDDYKCASCDACSDTCTHSDCYERNHPCPECDACKSVFEEDWFCDHCGMCFDHAYDDSDHCSNCGQCGVFDICSTCGFCEWCAKNEFDLHCRECDACFEDRGCDASHPGDSPTHCEDCALICVDCGNCFYGEMFEYCFDCHMCNECAEGKSHCIMCGDCAFYADYEDECIADAADYFVCLSCCEGNGHHCSECGEHVGNGGPWCETGGDGSHCETCAQAFTCEQCGDCALCKGDELCEDCGLCRTCCLENVYDEYGCVCDEYCTATIEDSGHLGECGHPTCTYGEICEYCGLCEQCCDENKCEHGYCVEDPYQEDHICEDCGVCFYEDELCEECSGIRCYDCCHERSKDEGCTHGICLDSSDWDKHWCVNGHCIDEYCSVCGGCKSCCDAERGSCTHDFTCPNDSKWEEHFCVECNKCFEMENICSDCGLCLDCCDAAAEKLGCTHGYCIGSYEWQNHYCYTHDKCITSCVHPICKHEKLSSWNSNADGHWKNCADCGAKLYNFPVQKHVTYGWTVVTPATTTSTGVKKLLCGVCGYEMKSETIPEIAPHACTAEGPSWGDANGHWRNCGICGAKMETGKHDLVDHRCTVCEYCDIAAPVIVDYSKDPKVYKSTSGSDQYMTLYIVASGEGLTYQWYEEAIEEGDGGVKLEGQTNARLRFKVQDYFGTDLTTCNDDDKTASRFVCVVKNAAGEVPVTIDVNFECVDQYWQDMDGKNTAPSKESGHILTCGVCEKTEGSTVPHRYNGTFTCVDCGHVKPPVIKGNPKADTAKVTDDGSDKMSFSVTALGDGLEYQWYCASYTNDAPHFLLCTDDDTFSGSKTATLTITPGPTACVEDPNFQVYCIITDAGGNEVRSATGKGKVEHNYHSGWSANYYDGTSENFFDATYHWRACMGEKHYNSDFVGNVFERTEHTRVQLVVSPATTGSKAKVKDVCKICGWQSEPYEAGEVLPECTGSSGIEGISSPNGKHDWMGYGPILPKNAEKFVVPDELKDIYSKWSFDDVYPEGTSIQHAYECRYCGTHDFANVIDPPGAHTFGEWSYYMGIEPTEEHGAILCRPCGYCEAYYEARVVPALSHTHTNGMMQSDETHHWNICTKATCTEKLNMKAHSYGAWSWTTEPTDTVQGVRTRTCNVCAYVQTQNTGYKTYPIAVENGTADVVSAVKGETAHLTADIPVGATFKRWIVVSGGAKLSSETEQKVSFTMPGAAVSVKAEYAYNGSSGGGGGGGASSYAININNSTHGTVTADRNTASSGTAVTLNVKPDQGWTLETLTVKDASGKELELEIIKIGEKYTFKMPSGSVNVNATFMEDNTILNYFIDVPTSSYYYNGVLWAVDKGITKGTNDTHFNPDGVCSRAQAVTFLWRAAGSPAAKSTAMPFTDVKSGSYYYDAVLWAVENGITKGFSETAFAPELTCSRGQIVTFLWRAQKSPAASEDTAFSDVKSGAYYADAVSWAVGKKVTNGTTSTTFSPDESCTRAQIVTFIWRAMAEQ